MNKRIIILLLLVCTSASSIFAQTVEDKKKVDIQSNSSVKAGEQVLSVEPIKAELPDEINKKGKSKWKKKRMSGGYWNRKKLPISRTAM